jgi:hypothetical protein
MIDIGSPILALSAGINYLNKYKRCNLKFVFVEKCYKNYRILCKNILNWVYELLDPKFTYGLLFSL